MPNSNRRATWMIGDCRISCEPRITSMVMASEEKEKAPRPMRARAKAKPARGKRAKSKRT